MSSELNRCMLCPRKCMVNRNNGELGFCQMGCKLMIGNYSLHMWEEPFITGKNGSGTIFFSGCNLRCLNCQNYYISEYNNGVEIEIDDFVNICLKLQDMGAENINLVTPTHFVPMIVEGIKIAKKNGLKLPIVYNSSGYERVETLKLLEDVVDIYLPDFKFYSNEFAYKYSLCKDYFEYTDKAICEMVRQRPKCIFNDEGVIIRGVVIRHLLLPTMEEDSKKLLKHLYNLYGNNVYYSIMNQYTPVRKCKYKEFNRKINPCLYDEIIDYAWNLGIRCAFVQEEGSVGSEFIPKWNFKL